MSSNPIREINTLRKTQNKDILSSFLELDDDVGELYALPKESLDREAADAKQDKDELTNVGKTGDLIQIEAALAQIQEQHRVRRDYVIIEAGHRELMLSCLRGCEYWYKTLVDRLKRK